MENIYKNTCFLLLLFCFIFYRENSFAQKHMEMLGRGVVAARTYDTEVFISWRLLGTDPDDIAFNVYRGETKINGDPIANRTYFVDQTNENHTYAVRSVIDGKEINASKPVQVWEKPYLTISLQVPPPGVTPTGESYTYSPNDCSVGDLTGDGEYEIIVKWDPSNSQDNSFDGYTGNVYLDAYKLDGTLLWRIDLGKNIRAGAHYTQFIVYDLNSDGFAEVACKTADGTIDGLGNVIGDADADHRNSAGRILSGPEYLTIFNGSTGAAMATTDYYPQRHPDTHSPTPSQINQVWGDSYGNRIDRFLAGVGYFDGTRPSLLMTRGYYTRTVLAAYDWRGGRLTTRWIFDSDVEGEEFRGQGFHSLSINDVDGDGKDEVVFGSMTVDDDGTILNNSTLGHGDAMHVTVMDPDLSGQQIWTSHESPSQYQGNGLWLRDAKTGEKLWGVPATDDIGRALAADIDPTHKGLEMWGTAPGGGIYNNKGVKIAERRPSVNFAVWWDGDLLRELLDSHNIDKWNHTTERANNILNAGLYGAVSNNGTKSTPALSADILGDWREEVIFRHNDNKSLLVFTSTIPTEHRLYTLMHDPQYRVSVAWQNVGYNQPPHTSFYLGHGMDAPPKPNIREVGNKQVYEELNNGDDDDDIVTGFNKTGNDPINVYPNPSMGQFLINTEGEFDFVIMDQLGKTIEKGKGYDQLVVGNRLKTGIYMLQIFRRTENKIFRIYKM